MIGAGSLLFGAFVGFFVGARRSKQAETLRRPRPERTNSPINLQDFYALTTTLINTVNYERVLDIALDMSIAAFEDAQQKGRLVCAVLLFNGDQLIIQSARRLTTADLRNTFYGTEGALAESIQSGEPVLIHNSNADPEIRRIVALSTCDSVYLIPLRSGLDIYGVLVFGHPDRNFFNRDRREILDIVSAQAISAMQNAQLYNALEEEKERMMEAQEEARKKLARDLHDGPTQSVSAIAMRVNFARRLLEKDIGEAQDELYKIEDLAVKTTKEIRHMLFTLRPLVLESQGLKAALTAMAAKVNETYNQNVIIEIEDEAINMLDMGKLGVLFFIIEEGVNNARKHAQADHIWVRITSLSPDVGLLELEDDGVGFDVQEVTTFYDNRGSLGMYNLKERAELINGILQIDSHPGHGTKIQVFIPFTEAGVDRLWKARS